MIALAFAALLLPGLAWWAWLGKRDQDPLISLAKVLGVSIAVISLTAEVFFLLGIRFSLARILLILWVVAAIALAGILRFGIRLPRKYHLHLLIGLILFGMTIAWRLYQARDLLLPNWVDSQHHYLIIRVMLEKGGLPGDLSPYLQVPFYYHYGFHAVAAFFTALSGLEIGESMLLLGQVLNAAISLSAYALAKTQWRDWRPAAAGALLVSFATRMPAYYLTWGRYTLTVGMILLPLALVQCFELVRKGSPKRDTLTLGILTAGVLLSHYFTAVLLALFMVLLAVVYLAPRWKRIRGAMVDFAGVPVGAGLGLLLAGPWLLRVVRLSVPTPGVGVNLPGSTGEILNGSGSWDYIFQLLGPTSNHWLLLAAVLGLILALVKLKCVSLALWTLILAVMSLPWTFVLRPFRPDHFAIVLFLPVALWAGTLFRQVGSWVGNWLKQGWVAVLLVSVLVVTWIAWSFPMSENIINRSTVLVTEDDLQALDWVRGNTPADARFYINTAHWLSNIHRGVDGGGWLLPYTGRWSLVPTVFYGFSPDKEMNQQLRGWGKSASEISTCSDAFWSLVEEAELGWVYVREGVGSLQPKALEGCEGMELVFSKGSVFIYEISIE